MKKVLLDTSILVDWIRAQRRSRPKNERYAYNSNKAILLIIDLINEDANIYISCHTLKELLQYPHISEQEEQRIRSKIPEFCDILATTAEVAEIAGMLSRQSAEYREYHIEDCYIAATAIYYRIPLYTRNPGDFKYVPHKNLNINVPYNYKTFHKPQL